MDSLISIFHINVKLLIAQIINFGIIFFVLYRFAFKPIAKIMSERTKTIEKSLDDAKEIEKRLAAAQAEQTEIVNNAKKESLAIIEKANETAEENKRRLVEKTKEEVALIINQEKAKIALAKEESFKEMKKELADLVVLSVEKVMQEKLSADKDRELINKIIKQ